MAMDAIEEITDRLGRYANARYEAEARRAA